MHHPCERGAHAVGKEEGTVSLGLVFDLKLDRGVPMTYALIVISSMVFVYVFM